MILKDIKWKDSDSKILMQAFHGTESLLLSLTLLLVPQKLGKAKRGPKNLQGQSQSSRTPLTLSFVFTRSWQRTTQSKHPFRRGASSLLLIEFSSRRLHTFTHQPLGVHSVQKLMPDLNKRAGTVLGLFMLLFSRLPPHKTLCAFHLSASVQAL